ncbi:MAG: murein biosynthesis integral membrane protein MurJ [Timaviella obliquedivisa GSE-PSE-MK23-08B]|jgi:putative peptidoglycan lipid II flippase|nr:murein biosynthesis integral membrane protein MurJ [Timaviella obliquedivisa GSE-PSE-MK23-08B]
MGRCELPGRDVREPISCELPVSESKRPSELKKSSRSLAGIAGIVAIATLVSKVFGLGRQILVAAVFGVGSAYGAYQFATIIPSFFLILLGGINGPFHSAMVSVLAKKDKREAVPVIETISTLVGLVMLVLTAIVVVSAPQLLTLVAPGLAEKEPLVREIAIHQLRIMAPTAWFAGMIGIGFGALNAADVYWLPSISPLLSSVTIVVAVGGLAFWLGSQVSDPQYALLGGSVLAGAFVVGTVLQWVAQAIAQKQAGLGGFRLRLDLKNPVVKDVLTVMGPALFASGMLQINVYTDMYFTSYLEKPSAAVSALDYANLLVQTPLGILSNVILVPLLPVFSQLSDPQNWGALKQRIRQGILITAIVMLPLSGLMISLSTSIVRVVYQRGAFQTEASQLVATVLIAYAIGMFVYLSRDVLVRVFYALGDSDTPFKISLVNIFLNALFDYLLLPFGVQGLVLATVSVNVLSVIALTYFLNRRLGGLAWRSWAASICGLTLISILSGVTSWGILTMLQNGWSAQNFLIQVLQLAIAGAAGLLTFSLMVSQFRLPEVELFTQQIRQRLGR